MFNLIKSILVHLMSFKYKVLKLDALDKLAFDTSNNLKKKWDELAVTQYSPFGSFHLNAGTNKIFSRNKNHAR